MKRKWIIGPRASEWSREAENLNLVKDLINGEDVADRVREVGIEDKQNEWQAQEREEQELRKIRMAENSRMWSYLYDFEVTEVNNGNKQHSTRIDKGSGPASDIRSAARAVR